MLSDVLAVLAKLATDRRTVAALGRTAATALGFGVVLSPNLLLASPMRLLVVALAWLALAWAADALLRRTGRRP